MPTYDLKCPTCELKWEGFASVENRNKIPCPKCHKICGITQITYCASPEIYGFYDRELNAYVGSKKEFSQIKKSKNLEEVSPYENVSTTHPAIKENEAKIKQANSYINWFSR
tara:strand:- start:1045 stop:1380 length:336 start_codon:yes stop_codon:yes gene_type:complete